MQHEEFTALLEETITRMRKLAEVKGGEYAGDKETDRLANFKRNAERLGLHPLAIWSVYVNKHVDAVNRFCSDVQRGHIREASEPIEGRLDDVLVYYVLGKALIAEERQKRAEIDGPLTLRGVLNALASKP